VINTMAIMDTIHPWPRFGLWPRPQHLSICWQSAFARKHYRPGGGRRGQVGLYMAPASRGVQLELKLRAWELNG
jgi:hypothetical protein